MTVITHLTFLIHPYCYARSLGPPDSWDPGVWQGYHAREVQVAARWYEALQQAPEHEAVVYHPCFDSAEARALVAAAQRHLGDRFLIVEGRPELYSPRALAALAPEIEAAFRVRGKYAWSVHDLRIAAFSWHYARDLRAGFAGRGITWDAADLQLRAMGESFEGCATTWTTMLPAYLGCPGRVRLDYELAVPDTEMLLHCEYAGRVELERDVALYLFSGPGGQPLVHYKRERITLDDPSLRARIAVDPREVEVLSSDGRVLLSPGADLSDALPPGLARRGDGFIDLLVTTGRGRGEGGPGYYPREAPLFLRGPVGVDLHALARDASIEPESAS